jgi:hypothetical protein
MFEKRNLFIVILRVLLLSVPIFTFGVYTGLSISDKTDITSYIEYKPPIDLRQEWIDSIFGDYEKRADIYLSQSKYKDSPIRPYMLSSAAKDSYLLTGVFLPVELALAQAEVESSMGTKGRSPDTNPFNIGEYDTYTAMRFNSTYDGIKAYYKYMTNNYLRCKDIDDLLKQFRNCNNRRYATDTEYEFKIKNQINKISKHVNKYME